MQPRWTSTLRTKKEVAWLFAGQSMKLWSQSPDIDWTFNSMRRHIMGSFSCWWIHDHYTSWTYAMNQKLNVLLLQAVGHLQAVRHVWCTYGVMKLRQLPRRATQTKNAQRSNHAGFMCSPYCDKILVCTWSFKISCLKLRPCKLLILLNPSCMSTCDGHSLIVINKKLLQQ